MKEIPQTDKIPLAEIAIEIKRDSDAIEKSPFFEPKHHETNTSYIQNVGICSYERGENIEK